MDSVAVKKRVVAGFAWTAGTKLFVQIISWASTIVVARILLPSDYGILAVAAGVTSFIDIVMELGMGQGLIHESRTTRNQEDSVFYISLGLGLLGFLGVYLLAPAIALFYRMPLLEDLLPVLGVALVFSSLKVVPSALAMQKLDFRYRALVEMAATLLSSLTVVVLALLGFGAWSIVNGLIVIQIITAAGYLPLFDHVPRPQINFRELAPVLRYGATMMVSRLLFFFYSRADVFIAGRFVGERILGLYSMAFQLAEIPVEKIGTVFHKVAFPAIAHIKSDQDRARSYFLIMHRYLLVIAYPILIGVALVCDDLVIFLLTDKWQPIVIYMQLLCLINLVKISSMIMTPVLQGRGRADVILYYTSASAVVIIAAVALGIQYGMMGMIIAIAIANIPLYAYLVFALLRELNLRLQQLASSFTSAVVGSSIMTVIVVLLKTFVLQSPGLVRLCILVLAGAVSYIAVFMLFYRDQVLEAREGLRWFRTQ